MTLIIIILLVTTSIYLVIYQFGSKAFGLDEARVSLKTFIRKERKGGVSIERTGPSYKNWMPITSKLKGLEKKVPMPTSKIKRRLLKAGLHMGVMEFLAFKVLAILAIAVLGFIFLGEKFTNDIIMSLLISVGVGFLAPELWLNTKIKKRQNNIRRDLPYIIDLLNLCVSGGLDFMLAVNRVVKDLKPCELTQELSELYRETQMGKSRRAALKNLAWRVDMPETHSFVRTLVQADRMGTPMAEALNLQSEEMRMRRFQTGEAMALKAPIKLLFPLFVFILPVVLIIVGGPIMLQFMQGGFNVGF